MRETRTTLQIEANALDLEMFRLAERLYEFSKSAKSPDIKACSNALESSRHLVRNHMHQKDRRETA